jgi:uncharacterized Zn finger protein
MNRGAECYTCGSKDVTIKWVIGNEYMLAKCESCGFSWDDEVDERKRHGAKQRREEPDS